MHKKKQGKPENKKRANRIFTLRAKGTLISEPDLLPPARRESFPTRERVRDAEMTIKIIFERSSQKGGVGRGLEKRVDRGPILKFYCRAKAQEKQHFGKSHFYCRRFFPGNTVTIIWTITPLSTLQGVGLGGRKNPRIIVAENYCHFGAPYTDPLKIPFKRSLKNYPVPVLKGRNYTKF